MKHPRRYGPIDLSQVRTVSLYERPSKVHLEHMAGLTGKGAGFAEWLASLPNVLGVASLKGLAEAVLAARRAGRPVVWAIGGHVVKVGCGPVLRDLMERGLITAVAMNGATAIHDVELALAGRTSEDVREALMCGRFGMARETAEFFARCIEQCGEGIGLGRCLGMGLLKEAPRGDVSVLAAAARLDLPATVHVALGADVVHMHGVIDAARLGAASMTDFRIVCSVVADLGAEEGQTVGGVWCNVGSAVILPEVFLKAVAVARNLGRPLRGLVTANFDMIRHYRPRENVLTRPVEGVGRSYEIVGQHEIMLPLFRQMLVEMSGG